MHGFNKHDMHMVALHIHAWQAEGVSLHCRGSQTSATIPDMPYNY